MEARNLLLTQIETLRQELLYARNAVQAVDPQFRDRVVARFDTRLTQLETANSALRAESGQPLQACWDRLRRLQKDSGGVFDECLALIQGALARQANLDDGICALTDDLLDDLAAWSDLGWGRFTLPATSESYRDTAEIIRVRYPELSLWSLPLAAHEFGHFVGPELRQTQDGGYVYPFQARLKAADENPPPDWPLQHTRDWHHLQEHFADLYATYTLGPAFVAAFILLRLNPADAYQDVATHPAGARRVYGILWTLDKMDARESTQLSHPFRDVTTLLRELWQKSLHGAGQPEKLADAQAARVTQWMSELWDLLTGATPKQLALDRAAWLRVEGLAGDLVQLPAKLTHRDVLNAAWLARLQSADQGPYALDDMVKKAKATYQHI